MNFQTQPFANLFPSALSVTTGGSSHNNVQGKALSATLSQRRKLLPLPSSIFLRFKQADPLLEAPSPSRPRGRGTREAGYFLSRRGRRPRVTALLDRLGGGALQAATRFQNL